MSIGERLRALDAPDKVRGRALYVADVAGVGTLVGGVLRSPHAHARVKELNVEAARALPGVRAVLSARDVPGRNAIPLVHADWPVLASDYVRHVGEAVALLAAETPDALRQGLAAIGVVYEPLAATLDIEAAFAAGEVMSHWKVRRGEASLALERSDLVVVEATYRTPYQEHAYLEPLGIVAAPDGAGGLFIQGSLASPFAVQRAAASALGWPLNRVRVTQAVTGGSFGGKEEMPAALGAQAALLARTTGRPVRILLSREEDMACTSKRHPARIRCRTGATRDGHLVAAEVDLLLDGGAYATLSPAVLFRAAVHACGPYRVPNVRVDAHVVRTHKVPCGVFRGAGEPQVAFACEGQMDLLAERLGLDPLELRRKNALEAGDETITGQGVATSVGLKEVLARVTDSADWARKREVFARDRGPLRRGVGLAISYAGVGPGALGTPPVPVGASVAVASDGSVTVAVARGETGQGASTALAQIAAESLGCPVELVRVLPADTVGLPDTASSTGGGGIMASGNAVRDAAARIKSAMEPVVAESASNWREAVAACARKSIGLAAYGFWAPPETSFDPATGQGEPFLAYSFSANVVEVEVDTETGETRVLRVHSAHDPGRVVNPALAEGQVDGAVVQGLGYALMEEHATRDGRLLNDSLATYLVPTALDAPEIRTALVPHPHAWGPAGAKELGEGPIVPVAPALVAAIAHATGARLTEIPATAERVFRALREKTAGAGESAADAPGGAPGKD
jgi:CO/xanthine dehydrogenase Mo-binding subunit